MHRIKLLLGLLLIAFSLAYLLFGWVAFNNGTAQFMNVLICFTIGSAHVAVGGYLLANSIRERRREMERIDLVIRHLVKTNAGRVSVSDLSMFAEVPEEDAREYLRKRSISDVSVVISGSGRGDVFFFGQQFWNN